MSHGVMSINRRFSCHAFMTSADAIFYEVGHARPEVVELQFAVGMSYPEMSSIRRVVAIVKYSIAQRSGYDQLCARTSF